MTMDSYSQGSESPSDPEGQEGFRPEPGQRYGPGQQMPSRVTQDSDSSSFATSVKQRQVGFPVTEQGGGDYQKPDNPGHDYKWQKKHIDEDMSKEKWHDATPAYRYAAYKAANSQVYKLWFDFLQDSQYEDMLWRCPEGDGFQLDVWMDEEHDIRSLTVGRDMIKAYTATDMDDPSRVASGYENTRRYKELSLIHI